MMLDWCPVCENLIPPERYTVQLPPLPRDPPPSTTDDKPAATTTTSTTTTKNVAGGKPKRPGFNRQNSRNAPAKKGTTAAGGGKGQHTDTSAPPKQPVPTTAVNDDGEVVAAAPRRRTIISQDPTPLYCSEECRLKDEAASFALSQGDITWAYPYANGQFAAHYAPAVEMRSPLPIPERSISPPSSKFRVGGFTPSSAASTTTDGDSSPGLVPPQHQQQSQKRPALLQMTSMPPPPAQSGSGNGDVSSSAPATTGLDSIASHLPLDRWNQLPPPAAANANKLTHANGLSAVDLYSQNYPLAYNRSQMHMYGPRTSAYASRSTSRKPTPTPLWDDVTPTQSLLIPKGERTGRRHDDSLEQHSYRSQQQQLQLQEKHASKFEIASDSGSSDRSSTRHHDHSHSRSRSSHQGRKRSDDQSQDGVPTHRSRSSRSSRHSHFQAGSFGSAKAHFTSRQHQHPLSSSFSARDEDLDEHQPSGVRSPDGAKTPREQQPLPGGSSHSVPNHRSSTGSWSWVWSQPKMPEVTEHVPVTTSASAYQSPPASAPPTNMPIPLSTTSSSATIAALPASVSISRLGSMMESLTPSASVLEMHREQPKRNSSLANLASKAASFWWGGLAMTSSSSSGKSHSREGSSNDGAVVPKMDDPPRGRSRASSRASQNHQLFGNSPATATASSSLTEIPQSPSMTQVPLSMVTEDMPRAKRPLAPLSPPPPPAPIAQPKKEREKEQRRKLSVDVTAAPPPTSPNKPSTTTTQTPSTGGSNAAPKSAWDPDLVKGIKESRRQHSQHIQQQQMYGSIGVNPFHASPPTPMSPVSHHRRRTTSHSVSKSQSHSRSHSNSHQQIQTEDEATDLPRVQSNQSITSMTHQHVHRPPRSTRNASREPPSPKMPRGLSMTSLSQQAFGAAQRSGSMYGGGPTPETGGLNRTSSQPYVSRYFSTSPGPSTTLGGGGGGGQGNGQAASGYQGPTYPVLVLPSGTRKKKVWKKVQKEDGREEEVLVDGSEEEDVYEKKKRLFYFDG